MSIIKIKTFIVKLVKTILKQINICSRFDVFRLLVPIFYGSYRPISKKNYRTISIIFS